MTLAPDDLPRRHLARLREYRRFSEIGRLALGLPIESLLDECLIERGLLRPGSCAEGWVISDRGREALEVCELREAKQRRPHQDLAQRVARWLERQGRLTWLNRSFEVSTRNDLRAVRHLGLMPSLDWHYDGFLGPMRQVSRPDVISILPSVRRAEFEPWIFELKVSRRDFWQGNC